MSTIARDGQKVRLERLTGFAEIAQTCVAQPLTEGQQAACMSLDQVLALRIRRVLTWMGRALCRFELTELGAALDLDPSVISRDVADIDSELRSTAIALGLKAESFFPPRRQGDALHPVPSAEEEAA